MWRFVWRIIKWIIIDQILTAIWGWVKTMVQLTDK